MNQEYRCLKIKEIIESNSGIKNLKSISRKIRIVEFRNMYFSLCRKYTTASSSLIGSLVNRDHSTVLHGVKSFEKYHKTNQLLNLDVFEKSELEIKHFIHKALHEHLESELLFLSKRELQNKYRCKLIAIIDKYRKVINSQQEEINALKDCVSILENLD